MRYQASRTRPAGDQSSRRTGRRQQRPNSWPTAVSICENPRGRASAARRSGPGNCGPEKSCQIEVIIAASRYASSSGKSFRPGTSLGNRRARLACRRLGLLQYRRRADCLGGDRNSGWNGAGFGHAQVARASARQSFRNQSTRWRGSPVGTGSNRFPEIFARWGIRGQAQ